MLITKEIEFDMGHRIPNHKSKCRNIHGHRYKIEVCVNSEIITTKGSSDEGMVIDFGDLKEVMMKNIHDVYDHTFMMYEDDTLIGHMKLIEHEVKIHFTDFIPTVENIAKYFFETLQPKLERRRILLAYVRVWETPTCTAIYSAHDKIKDNDKTIDLEGIEVGA